MNNSDLFDAVSLSCYVSIMNHHPKPLPPEEVEDPPPDEPEPVDEPHPIDDDTGQPVPG
jgi:hypothetical protein